MEHKHFCVVLATIFPAHALEWLVEGAGRSLGELARLGADGKQVAVASALEPLA